MNTTSAGSTSSGRKSATRATRSSRRRSRANSDRSADALQGDLLHRRRRAAASRLPAEAAGRTSGRSSAGCTTRRPASRTPLALHDEGAGVARVEAGRAARGRRARHGLHAHRRRRLPPRARRADLGVDRTAIPRWFKTTRRRALRPTAARSRSTRPRTCTSSSRARRSAISRPSTPRRRRSPGTSTRSAGRLPAEAVEGVAHDGHGSPGRPTTGRSSGRTSRDRDLSSNPRRSRRRCAIAAACARPRGPRRRDPRSRSRDFHELFYHAVHLVDDDVDGRAGAEESVRPVRAAGHPRRHLKPALIIETGTASAARRCSWRMSATCSAPGTSSRSTSSRTRSCRSTRASPIASARRSTRRSSPTCATRAARCGGPVLVLLDSDHHAPHVTAELAAYAPTS
jgi:hypothetical protein